MNQIHKIKSIAHHRNGMGGEPFYAVLFTRNQQGAKRRDMVGIVFDKPGVYVAILDVPLLAEGNIKFAENAWRGEEFEKELREAIDKFEDDRAAAFQAGDKTAYA